MPHSRWSTAGKRPRWTYACVLGLVCRRLCAASGPAACRRPRPPAARRPRRAPKLPLRSQCRDRLRAALSAAPRRLARARPRARALEPRRLRGLPRRRRATPTTSPSPRCAPQDVRRRARAAHRRQRPGAVLVSPRRRRVRARARRRSDRPGRRRPRRRRRRPRSGSTSRCRRNRVFYDAARRRRCPTSSTTPRRSTSRVELVRAGRRPSIRAGRPASSQPETPQTRAVERHGRRPRAARRPLRVPRERRRRGRRHCRLRARSPAPRRAAGEPDPASFLFLRHTFPVLGPHGYGEFAAKFGGGRGHQGQDVFAACGTPMVAARGGIVKFKQYHSRAGYYLVIDGERTGYRLRVHAPARRPRSSTRASACRPAS